MSSEPALTLLAELIGYPTVSHKPVDAIAQALAERAEDAGGRVAILESGPGKSNVVARFGPEGTNGLVLSGHMDVVPTEGQDWSSDPYRMVERGGRLYGRGTADMKGFLAAATAALMRLRDTSLERELVLIWTHDEEVGCQGSRILSERWRHKLEAVPSLAWIGEPTDFKICRMHPGHTTVEVVCRGRAAHSSRPGLGTNAIALARLALEDLEKLSNKWALERKFEDHLECPFTVMNVGLIKGGTAVNIVPDHCSFQVGIRPLPGETEQQRIDDIREALRPAQRTAKRMEGQIDLNVVQIAPALLTPEGTPLEALLCTHAADPKTTAAPFATDGGNLTKLNMESLVFGPGSIDVAHRANEYIPAQDLLHCVDMIEQVVRERCLPSQSDA